MMHPIIDPGTAMLNFAVYILCCLAFVALFSAPLLSLVFRRKP